MVGGSARVADGRVVEVRVRNGDVAYGDLDDGHRDVAVVPLACVTGGTMRWTSVWLYVPDAAAPGGVRRLTEVQPFAEAREGGGAVIDGRFLEAARFSGGRLTTTWVTYADTDPNCCPSKVATVTQHLAGTALVNDGAPTVTDRPPAS
jgi:hypothetical protein